MPDLPGRIEFVTTDTSVMCRTDDGGITYTVTYTHFCEPTDATGRAITGNAWYVEPDFPTLMQPTPTPLAVPDQAVLEAAAVARAAAQQAEAERRAARVKEETEARERAIALLHAALTPEQRQELLDHRYFTVEGGVTKNRYRIKAGGGVQGNIDELNEHGNPWRKLCCAPNAWIPEADGLLGQKLFLEYAEHEFLAEANFTDYHVWARAT